MIEIQTGFIKMHFHRNFKNFMLSILTTHPESHCIDHEIYCATDLHNTVIVAFNGCAIPNT